MFETDHLLNLFCLFLSFRCPEWRSERQILCSKKYDRSRTAAADWWPLPVWQACVSPAAGLWNGPWLAWCQGNMVSVGAPTIQRIILGCHHLFDILPRQHYYALYPINLLPHTWYLILYVCKSIQPCVISSSRGTGLVYTTRHMIPLWKKDMLLH